MVYDHVVDYGMLAPRVVVVAIVGTAYAGPVTTPGVPDCSNNCPAGYGVPTTGGSVCAPCANNTFNAGDSQYCSACPVGRCCPGLVSSAVEQQQLMHACSW